MPPKKIEVKGAKGKAKAADKQEKKIAKAAPKSEQKGELLTLLTGSIF